MKTSEKTAVRGAGGATTGAASAAPARKAVPSVVLMNESDRQRDVSRRLTMIAAIASGTGLLGIAVAAAVFVWQPLPSYFAVTPSLSVIKMTPLSQPFISQQGLLDWTSEAVCSTLSLDFLHYREQLNASMSNYTPTAFQQILSTLQSSGTLKMIKTQRVVTSAIPTAAPVIVNQGLVNGMYAWKIQFPLVVSYETSGNSSNRQSLIATVMVTRVSTAYNPRGVAIEQINLLENNDGN